MIEDHGETHNPMRGYLLALSNLPSSGHVCVLQDDVIVCRNFAETLELIAAANPHTVVALFTSQSPRRTHNMTLLRWGRTRYVNTHLSDIVHVVGMMWPVDKASEFVEWITENPKRIRGGELSRSDDACVTRWMKLTSQTIRCTVPSIVQHPDDVPSVVNESKPKGGKDRTAAFWIGDQDPLELDWSG